MTLEQIIKLIEDVEHGVEGQSIGYHLHEPIRELCARVYGRQDKRFSEILKDLQREEL